MLSPSTRRAWIEITYLWHKKEALKVALHPEGVDRNELTMQYPDTGVVALHPEGVDRNYLNGNNSRSNSKSPSTRRAWIEITRAGQRLRLRSGRPPPGGRG